MTSEGRKCFACFNGVWMYRFSAQFSIVREMGGIHVTSIGFWRKISDVSFWSLVLSKSTFGGLLELKLHHMQFPPFQILYLFSVWASFLSLTSCPYHTFLNQSNQTEYGTIKCIALMGPPPLPLMMISFWFPKLKRIWVMFPACKTCIIPIFEDGLLCSSSSLKCFNLPLNIVLHLNGKIVNIIIIIIKARARQLWFNNNLLSLAIWYVTFHKFFFFQFFMGLTVFLDLSICSIPTHTRFSCCLCICTDPFRQHSLIFTPIGSTLCLCLMHSFLMLSFTSILHLHFDVSILASFALSSFVSFLPNTAPQWNLEIAQQFTCFSWLFLPCIDHHITSMQDLVVLYETPKLSVSITMPC